MPTDVQESTTIAPTTQENNSHAEWFFPFRSKDLNFITFKQRNPNSGFLLYELLDQLWEQKGTILEKQIPAIAFILRITDQELGHLLDELITNELLVKKYTALVLPQFVADHAHITAKRSQWKKEKILQRNKQPADITRRCPDGQLADDYRTSEEKRREEEENKKEGIAKGRKDAKPYPLPDSKVLLTETEIETLKLIFTSERALISVASDLNDKLLDNPKAYKDHFRTLKAWRKFRIEGGKVWCEMADNGRGAFIPEWQALKYKGMN